MQRKAGLAVVTLGLFFLSAAGLALGEEELPELRIHDGRFEPANLSVSANTPVRLKVLNSGATPVEFESFELNRERVVAPGQSITVYLPSLDKGTYKFFDDFHREAGEGTLTAR